MIECLKMHKENFDYCLGELIRESEEKDKEIERLNNKVEELMELYTTERHCKDDYKAIIKEVREYIGSKEHYEDDFDTEIEKVYKILDKENK